MSFVERALAVRSRVAELPTRIHSWALYLPVVLVAAVVRLVNLGQPRALVFDEVYYVRDAWTLWNLGFEAEWPEGVDFAQGNTEGFSTDPSFIAHPPLGKWIIGAGMALVGPENPFGWRLATAIAGLVVVVLTMVIARRLFRSRTAAALAGFMVALDGIAITMSRTALLDGILAAFILAAFLAVHTYVEDSQRARWLVIAGLLLGAATAVKWSGAYAFVVFALWIAVDAVVRVGGLAAAARILRATAIAVPVAVCTYLASWAGWLSTTGGYDRDSVVVAGDPIASALGSLWTYHLAIAEYNVGLIAPHGYQANPFTWLLMIRPTAFHYEPTGTDGVVEYVTSVANPVFWYLGVVALVWLVVHSIRTRSTRWVPVLLGVAATYLPWLLFAHRTMFQFYTVTVEPFLVLAAVWLLQRWWHASRRSLVAGILVAGTVVGVFFLPVWMGLPIPVWFAAAHYWFPWWI